MSQTFTHLWTSDDHALIHADGQPAAALDFVNSETNSWNVKVMPGGDPSERLTGVTREERSLAILRAVIWLDGQRTGFGVDQSTRKPPPYAAQNMAAWEYTVAKLYRKRGVSYDEWEGKHFAAASQIFKRVVAKYGTDVPEPDFA